MSAHPKTRARVAACLMLIVLISSFAGAAVWPSAPGKTVHKKSGTVVDASNAQDGYIVVHHKKSKKRLKVRVIRNEETYTYDLNGEGRDEVFPLQMGNGKYTVRVFEHVSGTKYAQKSSLNFSAELSSEEAPYLCPTQYVWYEEGGQVVDKSRELCEGLSTDREKLDAVRDFVEKNIFYDYILALNVKKLDGYIPDLEKTLSSGKGICFDISALTAALLRLQGIPVQLVVGYADNNYHAWNNVMIDGVYAQIDLTSEIARTKVSQYTVDRIY